MGAQNASGMVFWQKDEERYNLECVGVLPECDPKCPEVFPGWFE